jgi:thymidylate synthase
MRTYQVFEHLGYAPVVEIKHDDKIVRTKELINVHYSVRNGREFENHLVRDLKLKYVKREIEWYIRANRWDDSILQHAKIWAGCIGKDGGINSNYGQYLFGPSSQLHRVVNELQRDPNSRRAVAMILGQHWLHFSGIDQPCTMGLQFLIRNVDGAMTLNVIVTMRSQDAIFGLGNDVPAFMFILKVVASALRIEPGTLHMNIGSLHVYERHFDMLKRMNNDVFGWTVVDVLPDVSHNEAWNLIRGYGVTEGSALGAWLS